MKLAILAGLLLTSVCRLASAQATFKLFNTYDEAHVKIPSSFDASDQIGGGFIDGDDLFVVFDSTKEGGVLLRIPMTRNGKLSRNITLLFFSLYCCV
jgi:hypothetical protein